MPEVFHIQGKKYSLEELVAACAIRLNEPSSDFEKGIWEFIQFWIGEDQMFSISTSGSTGAPKQISIPKRWIIASAEVSAQALNLHAGMKAFLCIPSRFMGGVMMVARSLHLGMELYYQEPSSCPILTERMDFSALVPLQYQAMIDSGVDVSLLGTLILGGAPTSVMLRKDCAEHPHPIYATYGMTETVSHIALERLNGEKADGLFHAVDGVSFRLGPVQNLCVEIDHFDQLEVCTNDRVELKNAQTMKWLGRSDNVINSGGLKIQPEELEKRLSPFISQEFFIHKEAHPTLGEQVVIYIEGGLQETESEFLHELSNHLERKELPKRVYLCSGFVRTKTGKIKRAETAAKLS